MMMSRVGKNMPHLSLSTARGDVVEERWAQQLIHQTAPTTDQFAGCAGIQYVNRCC